MKTTKINIGVALSRNYDKISLEMLEEAISYETEEEFVKEVRKKFKLLRAEVEQEFKHENTPTEPTPTQKLISKEQKDFLTSLGFQGEMDSLTMKEASVLISELKNKMPDY